MRAKATSLWFSRVKAARQSLILDQPFFGFLSLGLELREDPTCGTAWVDGTTLGFSPGFVSKLSQGELVGLVAHETMHCACGHPWRRNGRDTTLWNIACDHAVNLILLDSGFSLPKGGVCDRQFRGKPTEWIYDRLVDEREQKRKEQEQKKQEEQEQEQGTEGQEGQPGGTPDKESGDDSQAGDKPGDEPSQETPQDDGSSEEGNDPQDDGSQGGAPGDEPGTEEEQAPAPSPQGEVRDAPDPEPSEDGEPQSDDGAGERSWKIAVQQASKLAAGQGNLPGGAEAFAVGEATVSLDWRAELRRFCQESAAADYSWTRPNRRYASQGITIPSLHTEGMGLLCVAIDTSSSIDLVLLSQFETELQSIVEELRPRELVVMYCASTMRKVDHYLAGEAFKLEAPWGGGTKFDPVFEHIAEELDETPAALVYFTDLEPWAWPEDPMDYQVLWATDHPENPAPFGEVLEIGGYQ